MRLSHGFCKYISLYLISSHYNQKWPGMQIGVMQSHKSCHAWQCGEKEGIWLSSVNGKTPAFSVCCLCVQTRQSRFGGLKRTVFCRLKEAYFCI